MQKSIGIFDWQGWSRVNALVLAMAFLAWIIPSEGFAWPVPDTGQTKCYNDTVEIPCPQPGEDFYGQDGNYLINPPSYTKLDAYGNALPDNAASWAMVRDNVTGLIWESKTSKNDIKNYADPHDADNTYTWYDSNPATNGGNAGTPGNGTDTEDFINALNSASFGGYTDWRLPMPYELQSIVKYGAYNPAIETTFFSNTNYSFDGYWSSQPDATLTYAAWCVYFDRGLVVSVQKVASQYLRAVRGGQSRSLDHFVLNDTGTVTDKDTGLMWRQATDVPMTWESALTHCEHLVFAGYSDWRLPTIKELFTLVDHRRANPAIDPAFFPGTQGSDYYSASSFTNAATHCWQMDFGYGNFGYVNYNWGKSNNTYVRAVRGGQNRSLGHLVIFVPAQASRWMWISDNIMPMAWDTSGIPGNVEIALSREGGKDGTFTIIEPSTPNDGSYTWTVTGPNSVNCALKITPLSDPGKATTQSLFTITSPSEDEVSTIGGTVKAAFADYTAFTLTNAQVTLTPSTPDGYSATTVAEPSGLTPAFTFSGVPVGDYTLTVYAEWFKPVSVPVHVVYPYEYITLDIPALTPYTHEEVEALIDAERAKCALGADGQKGLEDAIEALQTVSGHRGE
jgi:hypothetical protein